VRYANPVAYRQSDPDGFTQCVPPNQVSPSWLLTDSTGKVVSRVSNGDELIDPGNIDFQHAAIAFLTARCQAEGWDGVILDEINQTPLWSYPVRPAKYPTDSSWQTAQLEFVKAVYNGLHAAGKKCWINLGADLGSSWSVDVTEASDGACLQFFVGLAGSGQTLTTAQWKSQLGWAEESETLREQGIYHCSTSDPVVARLGLATHLLASSGTGVFACAVTDSGDDLWTADFDNALKLGLSLGVATQVNGVYTRQFEHGTVSVDATTLVGTIAVNGVAVPATQASAALGGRHRAVTEPKVVAASAVVEPKVVAASAGATIAALAVWALSTYVFHGAVPGPVDGAAEVVVPGIVAFVSGWLTRHLDR
jgi:hypothetical protein